MLIDFVHSLLSDITLLHFSVSGTVLDKAVKIYWHNRELEYRTSLKTKYTNIYIKTWLSRIQKSQSKHLVLSSSVYLTLSRITWILRFFRNKRIFPSTSTNRRLNGYNKIISVVGLGLMVFSANFKNNTAISWQSVGGDDNGTLNYIKLEVFVKLYCITLIWTHKHLWFSVFKNHITWKRLM